MERIQFLLDLDDFKIRVAFTLLESIDIHLILSQCFSEFLNQHKYNLKFSLFYSILILVDMRETSQEFLKPDFKGIIRWIEQQHEHFFELRADMKVQHLRHFNCFIDIFCFENSLLEKTQILDFFVDWMHTRMNLSSEDYLD